MKLKILKEKETQSYLSLITYLTIIGFLGLLLGCQNYIKNLRTNNAQQIMWGKAGVCPEDVWQNYDWIIVDSKKYTVMER